ncbi:MAG: carboxylating nicotinate-nucleotide diphosphorylase [Thiotrichaceae bacterium]
MKLLQNIPNNIPQSVRIALEEDIGSGDVTADLIPLDEVSKATIICRDDAVLAGAAWLDEAFRQIDDSVIVQWYFKDGDLVEQGAVLCRVQGASRSLLSGERVGLNFLQLLSATATITHTYVKAVEGTKAKVLDTRKTIPGLRQAQKYAVLCGGGDNHRIGLYDRVLIKENHIMAVGSISLAVEQAKLLHPDLKVEVETENLDEFQEASKAGADIIMLDNFTLDDMKKAVDINAGKIMLEASGGVRLDTVKLIAETGVDYISVGEITKDIKAVDLSMRFES